MKVKRTQDPKIIKFLRPYFIEDGAFNRDIIAKELFDIMRSTPDEIFVVVILEQDKICGFAISWLMNDREYIWLAQAWSRSGTDRCYGKEAIEMIKRWASKEHNIHEIRFETSRDPKAITRVWGFEPHATVMSSKF